MSHNDYLLKAQVMHKRLIPRINKFRYGVYYLCFPLSKLPELQMLPLLNVNGPGILSFYEKDHRLRGKNKSEPDNSGILYDDIRDLLQRCDIPQANGEIEILCLPRVLGYVFNPISLFFCLDKSQALRAVICEVSNTFGETHLYVCAHKDRREITQDDLFNHEKVFHVSPYLPREGHYEFRFAYHHGSIGAWIDYYDANGDKKLLTSLTGKRAALTLYELLICFTRYPLITLKVTGLIHYQALKLFSKRIRYICKPQQHKERISNSPEQRTKSS